MSDADSVTIRWDVFVSWVALKWLWSTPSDPRAEAHDRIQWVAAAVDSERAARIALGAAARVGNDEFDRLLAEWRASVTASSP